MNQPNSNKILEMRADTKRAFERASERFLSFPWSTKESYAAWLAQTHYFTAHSTRLLALAAARFPLSEDALHIRFLSHTREENGHQILATRDLETLGFKLSDFSEYAETSAFYQAQYYQIEFKHPVALFGYIVCLESIAANAGVQVYEMVRKFYGEKASTFLKVHSEEDQDHIAKALQKVAELPNFQQEIVEKNLFQSSVLYEHLLDRCLEKHESQLLKHHG